MAGSPLDSAIASRRSEKKSKRGVFYTALLGVAGLSAASSVFAASITIGSGGIEFSQGTQTIAACDSSITATLDSVYDNSATAFKWSSLTLGDIDQACDNGAIDIQIWSSSAKLVTITGTLNLATDPDTITISNATGVAEDSAGNVNTYDGIDGSIVTAFNSSNAAAVAADGARVVIEIN